MKAPLKNQITSVKPSAKIKVKPRISEQLNTNNSYNKPIKAIAFYLPQFHPVPENNLWWGEGFTEWTNVARAKPLFPGHNQPRLPRDLGFYDLRTPEVQEKQVSLARLYNITAFCFYYYWFSGRKVLERPLEGFIANKNINFPFCICWANESWSRKWDGSESDVLINQAHDIDTDEKFIRDTLPILKNKNYLQHDGKCILLIYRPNIIPNCAEMIERWRVIAAKDRIQLYVLGCETFGFNTPELYGLDGTVEFPPHNIQVPIVEDTAFYDKKNDANVHDYEDFVVSSIYRPKPPYKKYRGVIAGWDNTPRRPSGGGTVFVNSSPLAYEGYLRAICAQTRANIPGDDRFVFINAWNEWAEGTVLEPDLIHGHAYLEATKRALEPSRSLDIIFDGDDARLEAFRSLDLEQYLVLSSEYKRLTSEMSFLERFYKRFRGGSPSMKTLTEGKLPVELNGKITQALGAFDTLDGKKIGSIVTTNCESALHLQGWVLPPSVSGMVVGNFLVLSEKSSGKTYWAGLDLNVSRRDVRDAFPDNATHDLNGFSVYLSLDALENGIYTVFCVTIQDGHAGQFTCGAKVQVIR
jgi:hypothetical protein